MASSSAWMDEKGVIHYRYQDMERSNRSKNRRSKPYRPEGPCDPERAKRSERQERRVVCQRYVGKVDSHSLV